MSKWIVDQDKSNCRLIQVVEEQILSDGEKCYAHVCSLLKLDTAKQIVREHNAHAELVLCLKAMIKITFGECRGDKIGDCMEEYEKCALSAQARAAIEAAEGRKDE